MAAAFEIVAHARTAAAAGGGETAPETIFVGPDLYDAPWDLRGEAERIAAERGLHIHRCSARSAYLSDGETFVSLYVRKET